MPNKKIIIIGSGIAGIATAIRLAVKGHAVEVFEANATPGGMLAEIRKDDFRFDAGSALLTMPQYIDELFELAGKDRAQFLKYQKLDVVCKYFYEDGSKLTAYADEEKFDKEVTALTGESTKKHRENSSRIYELADPVFLQRPYYGLKNLFDKIGFKVLLNRSKLDASRTMHKANQSFFKDMRIVQFYDRYATLTGSNPYTAPATLNMIPHLEQHFGAYFPEDGMYNIITALVKLAESLGVKFHYKSPVEEIVLTGKKVTGVKINGELIDANMVISNVDVWSTYNKLLSAYPRLFPKKILQQERSSSALVFYWGIKKQFSRLSLHNIFFSADYEAEFDHIWKEKNIYHDPTVHLSITSKLKPKDAPHGCENWMAMINVPANAGQNWTSLVAEARNNILAKLSGILNENISHLIISESLLDPPSIESKRASYQGSIYGTSANSGSAAFLRHPNRSSKIKNLYFCGGSVHPGGGIPFSLLSAKIVSEMVG